MAKSGLVSTPRNFKLTHFPAPAGLAFHGRIGVPCRLLASQACVPCQFFRKGKSMSQIGFIGLGIMGRPMSRNLMKAGHNIVVYDVVPALADAVIADGAARGTSCRDVAARSEVVITMLPDGPEVEQAVLGPDGVLEGAAAGTIIVDMSSISPMVSQKGAAAQRRWKPVLIVAAGAALMMAPWTLRALVLTGNPVAPLMNSVFPNPYFH